MAMGRAVRDSDIRGLRESLADQKCDGVRCFDSPPAAISSAASELQASPVGQRPWKRRAAGMDARVRRDGTGP